MDVKDLILISRILVREAGFKRFLSLVTLVTLSAICDLGVVVMVAELVSSLLKPDGIVNNSILTYITSSYSNSSTVYFFVAMLLIASALRLYMQRYLAEIAFTISAGVAVNLLHGILAINPVLIRSKWKTSKLMSLLSSKIDTFSYCIVLPILSSISAILISIFLFFALVVISGAVFLFAFIFCALVFLLIRHILGIKAREVGGNISLYQNSTLALLQSAFVGILDVKANRRENLLLQTYEECIVSLTKNQSRDYIYAGSGRVIVEFLGLSTLAIVSVLAAVHSESAAPIFGALAGSAFALQRLLPNLQLINTNLLALSSGRSAFREIVEFQKIFDVQSQKALKFLPKSFRFESVNFNGVSLAYPETSKDILSAVEITIGATDKVAITGPSGAGKSSLLLALLGFLKPTVGKIVINNQLDMDSMDVAWLTQICFVGQDIIIYDGTIESNMRFGLSNKDIDDSKFESVCDLLELKQILDKNDIHRKISFGGTDLSGGQRQRVALARALLSNAPIILLDEPTSSLDAQMSTRIIDHLLALDRCVIVVTHDVDIANKFSTKLLINHKQVVETSKKS